VRLIHFLRLLGLSLASHCHARYASHACKTSKTSQFAVVILVLVCWGLILVGLSLVRALACLVLVRALACLVLVWALTCLVLVRALTCLVLVRVLACLIWALADPALVLIGLVRALADRGFVWLILALGWLELAVTLSLIW